MIDSTLSDAEFVGQIVDAADTGAAFAPLIGSGFSSPSGIIMGKEFTNYLAFATYLVLADPAGRQRTHGEGAARRWDLTAKGWPPPPSQQEVDEARVWILKSFRDLCGRLGIDVGYDEGGQEVKSLKPQRPAEFDREFISRITVPRIPKILASPNARRSDDRFHRLIRFLAEARGRGFETTATSVEEVVSDPTRSYRQRVEETGIRSLHDWKETLVFLASAKVVRDREGDDGLRLVEKQQSVIDAFNSFITRRKQPNLGHKMLSHLSGPLRVRTVLTTNFDTLTEDA
ncbi:MAG: hypothetical protein AAF907_13075, partial [Planctomycetota bacterium]